MLKSSPLTIKMEYIMTMPIGRSSGAYRYPQPQPVAAEPVANVVPPLGRQITAHRAASEAPPALQDRSLFPLSSFILALKNSDFPEVSNILKPWGWTDADLADVKEYIELRRREFEHFGINESMSPMDEILYRLLLKSIGKKFIAAFPALMTFSGDSAPFYSRESVNTAQAQLYEDLCLENVEIFFALINKFRPVDYNDRVADVLTTCSNKLIATPSDAAADAFIELIKKFKPANKQELVEWVIGRVHDLNVIAKLERAIPTI